MSVKIVNLLGENFDKEVLQWETTQVEIIGQNTHDQLNKIYCTSLLDQARNYTLTIGVLCALTRL